MKVVVCQEKIRGSLVSGEELTGQWNMQLRQLNIFDEIQIVSGDTCRLEDFYDADAVIGFKVNSQNLTEDFLNQCPKLKYIATLNHGYGAFDKAMVKKKNVIITNTVYGDVTVAQFAMSLLLELCNGTSANDNFYRNVHFENPGEKCNPQPYSRQMELYGKTFGIIGLGKIGLWAARMAYGFGMHVVSYSRHKKQGAEYECIDQLTFDEVLRRSDVISLHCPLTEETKEIINGESINKMKQGVIIINTARGELIEEHALCKALSSGRVAAAGLDVLKGEPLQEKTEIFSAPNTIITPHIGWLTKEAVYRQITVAIHNLKAWANGKPVSVIS